MVVVLTETYCNKVNISRESLENCSNINFHENPSSGSRVVLSGQTDRKTYQAILRTRMKVTRLLLQISHLLSWY